MATAFLYAGQGSQHAGMGRDMYEAYPAFAAVIDVADAAVDFDLKTLMFEGPDDQLNLTEYTQPCMVAFACGMTAVLAECGIARPVRLKNVAPGQVELRSVRVSPEETLFYAINYGPAVEFRPLFEGAPVESALEMISGKEVRFPIELSTRQPMMFKVKK